MEEFVIRHTMYSPPFSEWKEKRPLSSACVVIMIFPAGFCTVMSMPWLVAWTGR